jgi:ABC-2 type transport system ATP-binding protein
MNGEAVIDVHGLTKRFGDTTVVDELDLKVGRGLIYGFLGPNGSGKTTTIRMVCGLLTPDGGDGTCLGFDVIRESERIKERVGYMTQRFSLYEDLSIRENLSFIAQMYGVKGLRKRVDRALADLGLADRQRQLAGHLSGGWKQRMALAACMIHEPELLLLDEPTAGVDPKARRDFWDEIRNYARQGVTTLVSTHYMDEAVQCDRIAFISHGHKLIDAPTAEIPSRVGLYTWRLTGDGAFVVEPAIKEDPRVDLVARFGDALHVCGKDPDQLAAAVAAYKEEFDYEAKEIDTSLEEAFIYLIAEHGTNGP